MRGYIGTCLAALLAASPALALDKALQPGVTGDLGGMRTDLKNQGWEFQARGLFEGATNPSGGDRQASTGAGQLEFATLADLGKLIGDDGGVFEAKITDRFGANLSPAAGLHAVMQPQEIWGRGDIWRLSQFAFSQTLFDKKLGIELGRINPGGDFDVFACNFQNLNFCGPPPGAIDGDYWLDFPVSQWGSRVIVNASDEFDGEAGVYQVNMRNITRGFDLDFGGQGVLVPYKVEWKPKLMFDLPGDYELGGWYSTMRAPDLLYDVNYGVTSVTGLPPLLVHGRSGFFISGEQQLTGEAPKKDAPGGTNGKGLTVFVNYTKSDPRTSLLDSQFAMGGIYKGAIESRADDEIALAFGTTHVNGRVAEGQLLHNAAGLAFIPVQHTEYVTEFDYRAILAPGAELTPNLQYIVDPGGATSRRDVLVVGLKATLAL